MTIKTPDKAKTRFTIARTNQPLHESVRQALENYFRLLDFFPTNLYEILLAEVEIPLLEAVMTFTHQNQSRAATILGLSRGTLRKKLKQYGIE